MICKQSYIVPLSLTNYVSITQTGGKTPWGTWISCEEIEDGKVWQVDPMNGWWPEEVNMGEFEDMGDWESFAYDDRDKSKPRFFVTEDSSDGALEVWCCL